MILEVHHLPDRDQIEREASEWIARLNADDVSRDDRNEFAGWYNAHALHARAFDDLSATWRTFAAAGPVVRAVSFGRAMNEAAEARGPTLRWLATATGVAVIASVVTWLSVHRGPRTTFETAIGERATISLPDGSILELNSNSLARVNYSSSARVIYLKRGEAYFKVAHNKARPFWVLGNASWVRAVGTAFNVDLLNPSSVRVTVTEGTVRVGLADSTDSQAPSDNALARAPVSLITAGQEVDIAGSAGTVHAVHTADLARTEAWRSGNVYFEKQPLGDVVDELGRYTPLKMTVDDSALRQLPVGGTFRANPLGVDAFLTMLHDGFGLNVRREGGRVYIESVPSRPDRRPDALEVQPVR